MMVPGIQVKSEDESLEASKRCRDLFAPYEQDLYMVSHSPDGTCLILLFVSVTFCLLQYAFDQILARIPIMTTPSHSHARNR